MGLTWILALITNWQQFAFLQFPSTILNSLQGIMLNYLRLRMSKTILFQLSLMAFLSDLEESDVDLYCREMDDRALDVLRKS